MNGCHYRSAVQDGSKEDFLVVPLVLSKENSLPNEPG